MDADATTAHEHPTIHDLFVRHHRTRRAQLRDQLVERHLGLARAMARRYRERGIPLEDLEQVAIIGLIKAIDRFDPQRGIAFSSFAVPTILGELRRHFRDHGWTVSVPRRLQRLRRDADRAREQLEQRLGRRPTLDEIAGEVGAAVDEVLVARDALRSCFTPDTLDDQPHETVLPDLDTDVDERATTTVLIGELLDGIGPREQHIVALRYGRGMTQREIADEVGLSQMHVSRLLRRSLASMQEALYA